MLVNFIRIFRLYRTLAIWTKVQSLVNVYCLTIHPLSGRPLLSEDAISGRHEELDSYDPRSVKCFETLSKDKEMRLFLIEFTNAMLDTYSNIKMLFNMLAGFCTTGIKGLARFWHSVSAMFTCSGQIFTSAYKYLCALGDVRFPPKGQKSTSQLYHDYYAGVNTEIQRQKPLLEVENKLSLLAKAMVNSRIGDNEKKMMLLRITELRDDRKTFWKSLRCGLTCFAIYMEHAHPCMHHYHQYNGHHAAALIPPCPAIEPTTKEDCGHLCAVNAEGAFCSCPVFSCGDAVAQSTDPDSVNSGDIRVCRYYGIC